MQDEAETTLTCYRHPNRETGLACANCDRPICAECSTATPVGQRCPECVGQQRTLRPRSMARVAPVVTYAIIAACVLVFVGPEHGLTGGLGSGGLDLSWGALNGPKVKDGEWWRVGTSMFMHASLLHIFFNMYALYLFGPMLEQRLGPVRFALLYLVSGIWGGAGALLASPNANTVGASGAIFGLMGAVFLVERRHGVPLMGGAGGFILINLILTFALPGISVGGHLGGLVGGIAAGYLIEQGGVSRPAPSPLVVAGLAAMVAVAAGLIVTTL